MESKFLVWQCDVGCGGIGDRFVGLVTCSIIAEIIGRQLLIDWKSPDISSALTINPNYDYKQRKEELNDLPVIAERWIDGHRRGLSPIFQQENLNERWKDYPVVVIRNNQPFHLLLWKNPYYASSLPDYRELTHQHYKKLFKQYFTLSQRCYQPVEALHHLFDNAIALHMRFGDWNFNGNRSQQDLDRATLAHSHKYANKIKASLIENFFSPGKKVKVLLLSDANSSLVLSSFQHVFASEITNGQVEFCITNSKPIHLGLYKHQPYPDDDICQIFSDLIIISRCRKIIFWNNTNFARISILALAEKPEVWIYTLTTNLFERINELHHVFSKDPSFYN